MCQPLAVAGPDGRPDAPSVDIGKIKCEAGIPRADAFGVSAGEIRDIIDGRAKAGRADKRAVRAGQAAFCDIIPAGMFEVRKEGFLQAIG